MPGAKNEKPVAKVPKGEARTEQLTHRLLDAATQLFMEKGFDATSMGEISARAHASKETFYRHFPTKDELFRAVILRRAEMVARDRGKGLVVDDPPEKALTAFGERMLAGMMTGDSIAFHRILGMARDRFPELLELYRNTGPDRVRDAVTTYMQAQMSLGRLRIKNPEVAARQFFDLVAAEMIIKASISGKGDPPKAGVKQRVKEAVDCFLHGYGA
jgi:TetR/AcrR family transcriptional repressor of mexJK operon